MFMFMRKFRKNFKGDSLIEVITAFAIVSIVGLITISGVVTSGRIKVQTTHIKNASYKADELVQTGSNESYSTFSIYSNAGNKYYDNTKPKELISEKLENISCNKYSSYKKEEAAGKKINYRYFDSSVSGSGKYERPDYGKGSFGMSGQWAVRTYLDPNVELPSKFYVEVEMNSGFSGETLTSEASVNISKNGISLSPWSNWWVSTRVGRSDHYRINRGEIKPLSSISPITFDDNVKQIGFLMEFDNSNNDFDYQAFDFEFFWSERVAYGLNFYIINAVKGDANYGKDVLAKDGSDAFSKITVWGRNFQDPCYNGSSTKVNRDYSKYVAEGYNWFKSASSKTPNSKENIEKEELVNYLNKNYKNGNHNCLYDYDNGNYEGSNAGKYIYLWTKDDKSNSKWGDGYTESNRSYMLLLNYYCTSTTVDRNNFRQNNDQRVNFREYLRIQSSDDYEKYWEWLDYCKNLGIANSEADFNSWVPFSFYNWYLLDKMKINESDKDVCYIDKSTKSYIDLISTLVNDNQNAYFCINTLCYWWLNDQPFLEEVKKYITDKGYGIININNAGSSTESHVSSYYRAFWIYYYISKGNTYQGFNSFDDYVKSFSSSYEFNYIAAKEVYDYFVNKEQASQRETNYANFKKDCTYTNEQITHLDEAFKTIKSMVESDAVNYANTNYSEDYLVKEMIMYVYNKTYYDNFLEDMRKATVEMSSNTRFDKKAYKDNFPQKWDAYSKSVLNSQ